MELIDEPTRVAGYFQLDSTEVRLVVVSTTFIHSLVPLNTALYVVGRYGDSFAAIVSLVDSFAAIVSLVVCA